jgi:hypothetical protein
MSAGDGKTVGELRAIARELRPPKTAVHRLSDFLVFILFENFFEAAEFPGYFDTLPLRSLKRGLMSLVTSVL